MFDLHLHHGVHHSTSKNGQIGQFDLHFATWTPFTPWFKPFNLHLHHSTIIDRVQFFFNHHLMKPNSTVWPPFTLWVIPFDLYKCRSNFFGPPTFFSWIVMVWAPFTPFWPWVTPLDLHELPYWTVWYPILPFNFHLHHGSHHWTFN